MQPIQVRDYFSGVSAIAILPYRVPLVQAFVTEAKYQRNKKALEFLGEILAAYIRSLQEKGLDQARQYVLVPLPLGKKRLQERGYNQVEEIVRYALTNLQSETFSLMPDLLFRTRDTVAQTTLGREARKKNMQGAFGALHVLPKSSVDFSTYILIDDVLTTGATLFAAYEALRIAGTKDILLLTLAH
jgi:predicted amidophosphoribosyltransferase